MNGDIPALLEHVEAAGGLFAIPDPELDKIAVSLTEEQIEELCNLLIKSTDKGFGYYITNVVSLGAKGRIEHAQQNFLQSVREFTSVDFATRKVRSIVQEETESLTQTKIRCASRLKLLTKLSNGLIGKERRILDEHLPVNMPRVALDKINFTIEAGNIALNAVKSATSGAGIAATTWTLVGTLGTASTGTAISTLSGAAATNATLAWLGGGSLAAGGSGMAGGAMVLGGVAVVPAIMLYSVFSHVSASRTIRDIEKRHNDVVEQIAARKGLIDILHVMSSQVREHTIILNKSEKTFLRVYRRIYWQFYPFGILSRVYRAFCKRILGRSYFTVEEYEKLREVIIIAQQFAQIIDQPLMNSEGKPVKLILKELELG